MDPIWYHIYLNARRAFCSAKDGYTTVEGKKVQVNAVISLRICTDLFSESHCANACAVYKHVNLNLLSIATGFELRIGREHSQVSSLSPNEICCCI